MRVVTYGVGMRSPLWRVGAALAVVSAALVFGGCAAEDPIVRPSPDPSSTPLFASDEEALAAAEEAYGRYQAVENQIFAGGGLDGNRIENVAVGEALEAARAGIASFEEKGYKSIGDVSFKTAGLQHFDPDAPGGLEIVSLYICLDFSAQDVVDDQGISVVNPERSLNQAFETSFDYSANGLILSSREPWTSDEICA